MKLLDFNLNSYFDIKQSSYNKIPIGGNEKESRLHQL